MGLGEAQKGRLLHFSLDFLLLLFLASCFFLTYVYFRYLDLVIEERGWDAPCAVKRPFLRGPPGKYDWHLLAPPIFKILVAGTVTVGLALFARTAHFKLATLLMAGNWLLHSSGGVRKIALFCDRFAQWKRRPVIPFATALGQGAGDSILIITMGMVLVRMRSLERSCGRPMGLRTSVLVIIALFVPFLMLLALKIAQEAQGAVKAGELSEPAQWLGWDTQTESRIVIWFICSVVAPAALTKPLCFVIQATRTAPEDVLMDTRRARTILVTQILSVFYVFASTLGINTLQAVDFREFVGLEGPKHDETWQTYDIVITVTDVVVTVMVVLVFSGALVGAGSAQLRRGKLRRRRTAHRKKSLARWASARLGLDDDALELQNQWDAKVKDLGNRAITLRSLLAMYRGLKQDFPWFEASRSTTEDVVRQVIIPKTKHRMCCGADIYEGRRLRPQKMVTHNWANLFRDLVAAIVADALEESTWSRVAVSLMEDMDTLEKWVETRGLAENTYWVCCFAVNQHESICGMNPTNKKDSVTQNVYPLCNCSLPKAFNETEPTMEDGRSIPCEMNKFDDMMRHLSITDPHFGQIVAVDTKFELFSRAWCIAEVAASNEMGMSQALKIRSSGTLEEHSAMLRRVRVEDMEVTRTEDREQILKSIPDKEAFNASLQALLFKDLIPAWSSLDTREQMAHTGRIIRWMGTASWKYTLDVYEERQSWKACEDESPQQPRMASHGVSLDVQNDSAESQQSILA